MKGLPPARPSQARGGALEGADIATSHVRKAP
jgi:hypothetical protein